MITLITLRLWNSLALSDSFALGSYSRQLKAFVSHLLAKLIDLMFSSTMFFYEVFNPLFHIYPLSALCKVLSMPRLASPGFKGL